MLKVYVAGPYSANNVLEVLKNIGRGQQTCALLFQKGFAPFCPWHDKSFVIDRYNEDFNIDQFYKYSIEWLRVSDAMLVIGEWESSKGTVSEIEFAKLNCIPIFYDIDELLAYRDDIEK